MARIDIVDSTRNGVAIGGAVGAGVVAGVYLLERSQPDSSLKGLATSLAIIIGLPVSLRLGQVIDRARNDAFYERQSRPPAVVVAPLIEPGRVGVVVQVRTGPRR